MRGSVELHERLVVWARPEVIRERKFGCIGGHPTSHKAMRDNTEGSRN